jgi:hypothetical protein
MRRLLLAVGLCMLGVAGFALAGTVQVQMTEAGPVPERATVKWGDTVVWTNADSRPHRITIPRLNVETPFVGPGGTLTHVFDGRRGSYGYRQLGSGPNRLGYVFVELEGSVTLNASKTAVRWGNAIRLSGTSTFKGYPIKLVGRVPGSGARWAQVAQATTGGDGGFSFEIKPEHGAQYRAQAAADQIASPSVRVSVMPNLTLTARSRRVRTGKTVTLVAKVTPAHAATLIDLQRQDVRRSRWLMELRKPVRGGVVTFKWKVEKGRNRIRLAVRPLGLKAGWSESFSAAVIVTGVGDPPAR